MKSSLFSQRSIFERVGFSYLNALRSQLHARMLLTLLLPLAVGLAALVMAYVLFFSSIKGAFIEWLEGQAPIQHTELWLANAAAHSEMIATVMGWLSLKSFAGALVAIGVLLPFIAVVVFAVMAFATMPIVVGFLRRTRYPELSRAGRNAGLYSMLNALKVVLVFSIGWLLTMPLWLIPPFAILLPIFWWGYAFKGFLAADAIAAHANSLERRLIFQRYRWDFWLLGLTMALLSLVPFFWLILPVFSALVFAHFSLQALSSLRAEHRPTSEPEQAQISHDLS